MRTKGQLMPARTEAGWYVINAGPVLDMMYHDDRLGPGREGDGIRRRTIAIAVKEPGKRTRRRIQRVRLDPFSVDPHEHCLPRMGEKQRPLVCKHGQAPLDAALDILCTRKRLLRRLEKAQVPAATLRRITQKDLTAAAVAIFSIAGAAGRRAKAA